MIWRTTHACYITLLYLKIPVYDRCLTMMKSWDSLTCITEYTHHFRLRKTTVQPVVHLLDNLTYKNHTVPRLKYKVEVKGKRVTQHFLWGKNNNSCHTKCQKKFASQFFEININVILWADLPFWLIGHPKEMSPFYHAQQKAVLDQISRGDSTWI